MERLNNPKKPVKRTPNGVIMEFRDGGVFVTLNGFILEERSSSKRSVITEIQKYLENPRTTKAISVIRK